MIALEFRSNPKTKTLPEKSKLFLSESNLIALEFRSDPKTKTLPEKKKPFLKESNPKTYWFKKKNGTKTTCTKLEDGTFNPENVKVEPRCS